MPIEERDSYSDEELARLDLAEVFAGGIRTPEGRMRGELQGIGSVAAAVQLEEGGVSVEELTRTLESLRGGGARPLAPPALAGLLETAFSTCHVAEDRRILLRWLGNVLMLMAMRARTKPASESRGESA